MRCTLGLSALGIGILLLSGPSDAADEPKTPRLDPETLFRFADTNKDGKVTREEFKTFTARAPKAKDNPKLGTLLFDRLDANKDGALSPDEFRGLLKLRQGQQPEIPKTREPANKPASQFNDKPSDEQLAFFEKKIRPALVEHCYQCHSASADKVKGGLALDTKDGTRAGGDSGPVIVPGDADRSLLVKAVRYKEEQGRMPPKQKLPEAVIADLEQWVRLGAPDPRQAGGNPPKAGTVTAADIEKGRQHWAFQPPKPKPAPAVKNEAWAFGEVDRFVLAKQEAKNLKPVGDADKRTLMRRAALDLTGLPPTPEEVEAFLADRSPTAFATVVDRLLASPAFGERWGRHWLDVARFAESSGKTVNFNYPHAWRYRDYVIAAFNNDKPYDQFIKEQIAGDLLASTDDRTKAERTVATGFLAIGPKALNERNATQFQMDMVDEQIDVVSQAFLGITAACARCHDHKFDPIPQKDYYALAGIFRSTETCYGTVRFVQAQRPSPLIALPKSSAPSAITQNLSDRERAAIEKTIQDLQKRMEAGDRITNILTFSQISLNRAKLDLYEKDGTPKRLAMGTRETYRPSNSPLYIRGEVDKPGEVVPRGMLQVLDQGAPRITAGSGRLELANAIASRQNPLTARVMVNRVWGHLFGHGLVPTPDNFGLAGQPPTHPELLDSLAVGFSDDGWSVKRLVRRLMLSHTYQLDSKNDAVNFEADPENALLWRMSPRRVEAEVLRDSMLAVSGRLDAKAPLGSPVALAGENLSSRPRRASVGESSKDDVYRSVYLPIVRDNLQESLALFDAADPSLIVAERSATTVPSQGLYLLNNAFVLECSDATAGLLLKTTTTDSQRVREAYLRFYGRPPVENELRAADRFLANYKATASKERPSRTRAEREVWSAFCQALFASAEFQYRR